VISSIRRGHRALAKDSFFSQKSRQERGGVRMNMERGSLSCRNNTKRGGEEITLNTGGEIMYEDRT